LETTWIDTYNEAVDLMKAEYPDRAGDKLLRLFEGGERAPALLWALGLNEIARGYPYAGLRYWGLITTGAMPDIADKRAVVQSRLPQYDRLYAKYNDAAALLQRGSARQAVGLFAELVRESADIRVPAPVFYGYLLALGAAGQGGEAADKLAGFPVYVQNHPDIVRYAEQWRKAEQAVREQTGRKRRYAIWGTAGALALVIGASAITAALMRDQGAAALPSAPSASYASAPSASAPPDTGNRSDETAVGLTEARAEAERLAADNRKLTDALDQARAEAEAAAQSAEAARAGFDGLTQTVALARGSVDELRAEASLRAYRQGRELLKTGRAAEAAASFRLSLEQGVYNYFSDDNLYAYITAVRETDGDEAAAPLMETFLAETNEHYVQSPYRDDVLWHKARYLLAADRQDEGEACLRELVDEYPDEWTGRASVQLLQHAGGDSE